MVCQEKNIPVVGRAYTKKISEFLIQETTYSLITLIPSDASRWMMRINLYEEEINLPKE